MHLKTVQNLLKTGADGSVGRKLEFLQQELLREVNTLGTKAQNQTITNHAVEIKSILERFREQVANVE